MPRHTGRESRDPGELVHTDLHGPMRTLSVGGARYYVTLYEGSSAYSMVRFLHRRSELAEAGKQMMTEVKTSIGKRLKAIRFDKGKEYLSNALHHWLAQWGTWSEPVAPYRSE